MSELVIPIALWSGPPPHPITSILLILSRGVVVTGASSGQLCIWSIETEKTNKEGGGRLTPLIFCLGHNAPITNLVECNFEGKDAFISVSTDGVMHVWSAQDGKCIGGAQFAMFHPLCLVCIPGERRMIALAGAHSDIEIVDAWTLKSSTTLRGHSDWVTCLGTTLVKGEPVLMSGSRDGLVNFWSLKPNEDFPLRTVCFDDGPIPDSNPLAVVVAPDARTFVLVTPRAWFLYTAQNSRLICTVASPDNAEWLGAKYLDTVTLLVWTSRALAAAYKLTIPTNAEPLSLVPSNAPPSSVEIPKNLSANFDIAPNEDSKAHAGVHPDSLFLPVRPAPQKTPDPTPTPTYLPTVLYTLNEFSLESPSSRSLSSSFTDIGLLSSSPLTAFEKPDPTPPVPENSTNTPARKYETSFSQFAACEDNFFAVGDVSGHVGMWIVRSDSFTPWCVGRVSDGWKGVEPPAKAVTTSLVIEDLLLLVRGHENGQISTCSLPTDPFPKYNKAHAARVNCLMCSPVIGGPNNSQASSAGASATQKRFLVSGSDDFTIKVWELSTFELLHTFSHHTGPITWLFPPPPRRDANSAEIFWDNTFFAVSEDKCVGMYSMDSMVCRHLFGVHPALVASVKSKREQDYLLVECVDGSVTIWEMGTGDLEGIVYGQVAREISENSDIVWTSFSHSQGVNGANTVTGALAEGNGPATPGSGGSGIGVRMTFIPNLLHRTPIQILFLDIKQIIRELYRTLSSQQPAAASAPSASSSTSPTAPSQKKPLTSAPSSSAISAEAPAAATGNRASGQSVAARYRQSLQLASSSATNATSVPAYQIFSYLIPWGVDKSMDALCKKEMMLRPPVPDFAFGIKGDSGNISVLVPSASGVGRWQCSPELTALITLAAVSLARALLNLSEGKNSCIQILSYYCALLPETLGPRSSYVDPSLPLLASYWLDPQEDIMSAARSILVSTIDRLSPDDRRELTQSVAMQLKHAAEGHMRGLLVVVLGIIGAERPEALEETAAQSAATELLRILYKGGSGPFTMAAVELLGKGFASWRPHVKDVPRLIRGLFTLSLQDSIGQTPLQALALIGAQDPKQFILCIGAEIHRDTSHSHSHTAPNISSSAVMVLGTLVKKDPCALLGQLPRLVETVVKSLDPHTPALRDACLKATTAVLRLMVEKYPMVSFHQESQRLAVGTNENVIIIYDLKTATRWHVLEGHKNSVSAVAFNDNGKALSSYSIMETTVRIWQTGTSFFGILGSQPQCVKTFAVSKPTKPIPPQMQLETVRLQWASPSTLTLFRGWEQGTTFTVDPVL